MVPEVKEHVLGHEASQWLCGDYKPKLVLLTAGLDYAATCAEALNAGQKHCTALGAVGSYGRFLIPFAF